ncbi:MAG: hypothetical protein Q4E53_12945 [Eubacteriales bacterium]|nr:hypothetical protein [Eubacteriales bacterium]
MEHLQILMDLNKKITLYNISGEPISPEEIEKARHAAKEITKSGFFTFKENTTDVEFFKEIQQMMNAAIRDF